MRSQPVRGHDSCAKPLTIRPPIAGGPIRTLAVSLIGAAALAAGLALIRQQKQVEAPRLKQTPAGETVPAPISLEKLRELGY